MIIIILKKYKFIKISEVSNLNHTSKHLVVYKFSVSDSIILMLTAYFHLSALAISCDKQQKRK